jgi:hypothetical protein
MQREKQPDCCVQTKEKREKRGKRGKATKK